MLKHLRIRNLALIQSADLDLQSGFCAVTGETGAGKSVLLSSLKICAGEKISGQVVRSGEEKAVVEAHFEIQDALVSALLETLGIDLTDGEVIIQREILANGKSRARVNGTLVNQGDLSQLGDLLIQLHGQSEQVLLRDVRTHLNLVDDFGDLHSMRSEYSKAWAEWRKALEDRDTLDQKAKDLAAQKEFLQFQFNELDKAKLVAGEEEELEATLRSVEEEAERRTSIETCLDVLEGDGGILEKTSTLEYHLDTLLRFAPKLQELKSQVAEASITLRETTREIRALAKGGSLSTQETERINARLALLQKLRRKYHLSSAELITLRDQRKAELSTLENLDGELMLLQKNIDVWHKKLFALGKTLSQTRQDVAGRLEKSVEEVLHRLGMPKAVFKVSLSEQEPSPTGLDKVEFQMAPNPGEGTKALKQAVSGGELSRVLLAFKTVMAHRDRIPLLIFDEVDSGISGEIAHHIGTCLQELGRYHQVLTITHLHQVASKAAWQLHVNKTEVDGRTYTRIIPLEQEDRIRELARMLGDPNSTTVLQHARHLYEENHGKRS